jgi:hypothetical protein
MVPIPAVSAEFALAVAETNARAFLQISFDPISAFILFPGPLKNTLAALFAVDVIWVFGLVIWFHKIVNFHATSGAIGYAVLVPQL